MSDESTGRRDWAAWHAPYDEPGSPLRRRLAIIQGHIASWLRGRDGTPVRVVSACAGQGRDLLGVLATTPHSPPVQARLVEYDPRNVAVARNAVARAGLVGVEVVCGDAGYTDAYDGAVPADLVLMCGVFGNISDADVQGTIARLPQLCAERATVIWTRSRRPPDRTPVLRGWLADAGFEELAFETFPDGPATVGVHRFAGRPQPLVLGQRLFTFVR